MSTPKPDAGWRELPKAGFILDAGNADEYKTGGWRAFRPIHNPDICINCLQCWAYCPDSSFIVEDGKITGIDYEHCKGCGICASVCPTKPEKAIQMVKEERE